MNLQRSLITIYLCLLGWLGQGCISWPSRNFKNIDEKTLRSSITTMFVPSVNVKFKMYSDRAGQSIEINDENVKREMEIFSHLIDKTHMVRRIDDEKSSDFIIEMQLRSDISKHNEYWLMASAATLTLVPYWGKTNLKGQLTLKDRGGRILKSYEASDSYRFIVNFFMFPALPFYWSPKIEQEIRENLYKQLISQLSRDGIQVTSQ